MCDVTEFRNDYLLKGLNCPILPYHKPIINICFLNVTTLSLLEDTGHWSTIGVGHSSTRDRYRDREEIEKELNIDIKTEVEAENRKLSSATAELCL